MASALHDWVSAAKEVVRTERAAHDKGTVNVPQSIERCLHGGDAGQEASEPPAGSHAA
jgi:hypothetical protein